MDIKRKGDTEYLCCSCCGGELDGNENCRSYCDDSGYDHEDGKCDLHTKTPSRKDDA